MKVVCVLLLFHLSIGLADASLDLPPPVDFNLENIFQIIDQKNISTLEELLPNLPLDLRSNFVLVKDSKSLQGSTLANPRVIMHGKTAKLIAAFNGDPTLIGFSNLEVAQFNEQDGGFEFYRINFPIRRDASGNAIRSQKNPPLCLSCHGSKPHSIWSSYNNWPDAYGTNDDFLEGDELAAFESFLQNRGQSERYKNLEPLAGSGLSPFSFEKRGDFMFRPNLRFGGLISRWNARGLAKSISSSNRFTKYAALFVYGVASLPSTDSKTLCSDLLIPTPIYDGLWTPDDAKLLHTRLEQDRLALGKPPIPEKWDYIKDLYFLYSDASLRSWSLQIESSPDAFKEFQNGESSLRAYVLFDLKDALVNQMPELQKYFYPYSVLEEYLGNQRLVRTPFDVQFLNIEDGIGMRAGLSSDDSSQCKLLIGEIKKQLLH